VSSNSKYVSARCKVATCESLLTFKIERLDGEGERKMIIRCNKFKNHHVHPPGSHVETKLPAMIESLERVSLTMTSPNAFEVLQREFKLTKKQFYYWRRKLTQSIPMPLYF
jgi:hypothetical protein